MTNQLLWALTQLAAGVAVLYVSWVLLDHNAGALIVLLVIALGIGVLLWRSKIGRSK